MIAARRLLAVVAMLVGVLVLVAVPAQARDHCGDGMHRNDAGQCVPNSDPTTTARPTTTTARPKPTTTTTRPKPTTTTTRPKVTTTTTRPTTTTAPPPAPVGGGAQVDRPRTTTTTRPRTSTTTSSTVATTTSVGTPLTYKPVAASTTTTTANDHRYLDEVLATHKDVGSGGSSSTPLLVLGGLLLALVAMVPLLRRALRR